MWFCMRTCRSWGRTVKWYITVIFMTMMEHVIEGFLNNKYIFCGINDTKVSDLYLPCKLINDSANPLRLVA